LNLLALDLTNEIHYIAVRFFGKEYSLEFTENNRSKRNDWNKKIDEIYNKIPNFDLKKIDANIYAAGPGSYTGARLAYTFFSTLEYINNTPFYAVSNLEAMNIECPDAVPFFANNNKDFFFRINGEDKHTNDINEIQALRKKLIGFEHNKDLVDLVIPKNVVVRNILEKKNLKSGENYPNYIKELAYKKL
tara:strand:- start:17126 stop:17695 length:570 start_codon:yes stop_codon:yes gene_type:complete